MRNPPRVAIPAILGPDFNLDGFALPVEIEAVLKNPKKNRHKLWDAFAWCLTPQGYDYWEDRANERKEISTDDIKYLRAALEFLAPAKRQTSAQRIATLEEENKSLREKLAKIAALAGESK